MERTAHRNETRCAPEWNTLLTLVKPQAETRRAWKTKRESNLAKPPEPNALRRERDEPNVLRRERDEPNALRRERDEPHHLPLRDPGHKKELPI